MSDIVTFPLFVTANEYDTRSVTRETVAGVALLTTDNAGACAIVTVPKEEPSDTVRSGAVPPAPLRASPEAPPPPEWDPDQKPPPDSQHDHDQHQPASPHKGQPYTLASHPGPTTESGTSQ